MGRTFQHKSPHSSEAKGECECNVNSPFRFHNGLGVWCGLAVGPRAAQSPTRGRAHEDVHTERQKKRNKKRNKVRAKVTTDFAHVYFEIFFLYFLGHKLLIFLKKREKGRHRRHTVASAMGSCEIALNPQPWQRWVGGSGPRAPPGCLASRLWKSLRAS